MEKMKSRCAVSEGWDLKRQREARIGGYGGDKPAGQECSRHVV